MTVYRTTSTAVTHRIIGTEKRCKATTVASVNRIATVGEQLTCLTSLQTVQLNRLHDFLPESITVGLSH
ncbi:MAG: hypothetical protein RBJ76_09245 [Stenomitos frigidus ULC029]